MARSFVLGLVGLTVTALGSQLQMKGDSDITMNGAVLRASCGEDTAGWLYAIHRAHELPKSGGTSRVYFNAGVKRSCANVQSLSEPCVSDDSQYPALFMCHWTTRDGELSTGPFHAVAAEHQVGSTVVGLNVYVDCEEPIHHPADGEDTTLSIVHSGRTLPFKGAEGHDSFRLSGTHSPTPFPTAFPTPSPTPAPTPKPTMAVQEQWGGQVVHGGCQAGYYNFWNSCGCCNSICGQQYPCHGTGVHNKRACPVNTYNPVKRGSQGMWSRCRSCPEGTDTRGQSASTKCYWSGTDQCAIGC